MQDETLAQWNNIRCKHGCRKGLCFVSLKDCPHSMDDLKNHAAAMRIATIPTPGMDRIGKALGIGGTKHDDGKLRYDLIPGYPLEELARVYTFGAGKYEDHNWRKGFRWGRAFAACMRHAWAWWKGERNDPVDGNHHLASAAFWLFALMEFEKFGIGEDDRWKQSS